MLPEERWNQQRQGGTWSQLFNLNALQNRRSLWQSWCGISAWECLGWQYSPCCAWPFPAWPIGCPLAHGRPAAALLPGLAGRIAPHPLQPPDNLDRGGRLVIMGLLLAYRQRGELSREFRYRWRYYLLVEGFSWLFPLRFAHPLWKP